jgi:phospholipid/cholesterol/gamma-HCH transport system permease protein
MTNTTGESVATAGLAIDRKQDTLLLTIRGSWKVDSAVPSMDEVRRHLQPDPGLRRISIDATALAAWDSRLLTFLTALRNACKATGIALDSSGLPEGARRLLVLASAVPDQTDTGRGVAQQTILSRIGTLMLASVRDSGALLAFVGEAFLSFLRMAGGRANFRRSDLLLLLQDCGAKALPIVSLISVLVGLILAFVGAVQLKLFGAEIYISSLVAIGMTREMGAMMTAVIMAGRTGAAFAAQLGTMQVNEEIDALQTLGISPMDFLVLPRMLALILMMPLLCIYADLMGILGGFLVGVGAFDITTTQYWEQTRSILNFSHIAVGVFKSGFFGVLIALAGCMRGIQSGRSASAVGDAATAAVVTAIVWIIVWDGLFAVITNVLKI